MLETKELNPEFEETLNSAIEDPFAVDFFGSSVAVNLAETEISEDQNEIVYQPFQPKEEKVKAKRWERNLPKISKAEANLSTQLNFLPVSLTQEGFNKINETLSHYIFGLTEEVSAEILDIREVDIWKEAIQATKDHSVFISFYLEPNKPFACIILDAELASHLVDKTLGGAGISSKVRRKLSDIEKTVIEFLGVSLLSELNNLFGQSVWKIGTIEQGLPNWITENCLTLEDSEEKYLRGISAILNLQIGQTNRIVTILSSVDFIEHINKSDDLYFKKQSKTELYSKFKKIKPFIDLRIVIGESEFRYADLINLDVGDYVFVEKNQIIWQNEILQAQSNIKIGAAKGLTLSGIINKNQIGNLEFEIEEVLIGEFQNNWERLAMAEEDLAEDFGENEALQQPEIGLENMLINVRVELAGRKMTLEEVSKLRKGQIFELGCKATDSVDLLADEKRIATGDLIDIEGNLGIVLTKVYI